jgi:tetratricopeptide (TPR) repeat protein
VTDKEWQSAMSEVVQLMNQDRRQAIVRLRALTSQTEVDKAAALSSWHSRQCLGLLAQLEADEGNLKVAAEIDEQVAESADQEIRELRHSSAFSFAQAALYRFKLGETEKAMTLATKALSIWDAFTDPGVTYELLLREVRRVKEEQAKHRA